MLDFKKYKIIFFGSSEFALPVLNRLIDEKWDVVAVITQPDRPGGRGYNLSPTPVKVFAQKKRLPVYCLDLLKSQKARNVIYGANADLAIVVSYGQLIPSSLFNAARLGFINIHPSLLPKYRGPAPIQYAILNGEHKTGVSLIVLDDEMDHGPIIAQEVVEILENDDYQSLFERLSKQSGKLLVKILPKWIKGDLKPKTQDHKQATYTKILKREDGRIIWSNTSTLIVSKIKAFTPWPGAWTTLAGERVKIIKAEPSDLALKIQPGQIRTAPKFLYVGCGNQTSLRIIALQPEGKRVVFSENYLRGHKNLQGQFFV